MISLSVTIKDHSITSIEFENFTFFKMIWFSVKRNFEILLYFVKFISQINAVSSIDKSDVLNNEVWEEKYVKCAQEKVKQDK